MNKVPARQVPMLLLAEAAIKDLPRSICIDDDQFAYDSGF